MAATALLAVGAASCAVGPDFVRPEPAHREPLHPSRQRRGPDAPVRDAAAGTPRRGHLGGVVAALPLACARRRVKRSLEGTRARARRARPWRRRTKPCSRRAAPTIRRSTRRGNVRSRGHVEIPHDGLEQPARLRRPYSLGVNVSYLLDVFGGVRRSVEQQPALSEFQRYELAAAWLTLTGTPSPSRSRSRRCARRSTRSRTSSRTTSAASISSSGSSRRARSRAATC